MNQESNASEGFILYFLHTVLRIWKEKNYREKMKIVAGSLTEQSCEGSAKTCFVRGLANEFLLSSPSSETKTPKQNKKKGLDGGRDCRNPAGNPAIRG